MSRNFLLIQQNLTQFTPTVDHLTSKPFICQKMPSGLSLPLTPSTTSLTGQLKIGQTSSTVEFGWVSTHCSLRFFFLADRTGTWRGCSSSASSLVYWAFRDALLLTTVVNSGYFRWSNLPDSSNLFGHSFLTLLLTRHFCPQNCTILYKLRYHRAWKYHQFLKYLNQNSLRSHFPTYAGYKVTTNCTDCINCHDVFLFMYLIYP